ncbi:hypothetical protein BVY02_01555 [bacterium J17]|nr:hypothetical protein BVY02_01555 [bacterium J17]
MKQIFSGAFAGFLVLLIYKFYVIAACYFGQESVSEKLSAVFFLWCFFAGAVAGRISAKDPKSLSRLQQRFQGFFAGY